MEWMESLKFTISYIEKNLLDDINTEDIARAVNVSQFYLQKGFSIITGYSIGEYIRCRRLYLSALDVIAGKQKIIDIAYKYGYDTPESFTKAFSRFHGISPKQMKNNPYKIKVFLPLKISIIIQGGNDMDYIVEKMEKFKVIGFEREFSYENAYTEIPKFWDEIREKYFMSLWSGKEPINETEKTICNCRIGQFGVNIDDNVNMNNDMNNRKFRYIIAGEYTDGEVPSGMTVYEFPNMKWAKFKCVGSMPTALQSVNTRIFREWLPTNNQYKIAMGANIEFYSEGDCSSVDYESGIWIPVINK